MTRMADLAQAIPEARGVANMHLSGMAELEKLLSLLLAQGESDPAMICVTDDEAPPQVISKDFPYEGATRAIVQRTPVAPKIPAAASPGLLYDANVNRMGGTIVNKAAAGLTIFFCNETGPQPGDGSIWIAPNGTWDFRLGNLLWCGHVYATPDSGSVNVAGCEL